MLLKKISIQKIKKVIINDFPEIKIKTAKLITNGWDNVVVDINGKYIFRFPKKKDERRTDIEIKLLDYLKDKITLPIPHIEFFGKKYTYVGYKKIQGGRLTRRMLTSLEKNEREKLVLDIASFLYEFHKYFSLQKARQLGLKNEDHFSYYTIISNKILNKLRDEKIIKFVRQVLADYKNIKIRKREISSLYNDLHEDNMAFDFKKKGLNGIFDFGDVMTGDINREFCYLFRLDPVLMHEVIKKYEKMSGRKIDVERVKTYARINEMSDLSFYINKPNSIIYRKSLKNIVKWMREDS